MFWELRDSRTDRNSRHELAAMFRQSLFGHIAGYEDVNDAGRLARDPVMRLVAEGSTSIVAPRRKAKWVGLRQIP